MPAAAVPKTCLGQDGRYSTWYPNCGTVYRMTQPPEQPPSDPWGAGPPPGHGQQPPPGWGAPPPGYGQQPPPGWGTPPPGYGYPPYGYAPQTEGKAIGALVAAILSFVVCPVVPAIVALVLAGQASESIRSSGGRYTGEGYVTAAKWIAWIHLALAVLGVLFFLTFWATLSETTY